MHKIILFICCSLVANLMLGAPLNTVQYFYKGKVNDLYSITVELNITDNVCTGRYFYDKYRTNMLFRGELKENNILLLFEWKSRKEIQGPDNFKGVASEDWSRIVGAWQDSSGVQKYRLDLKRITKPMGQNIPLDFESIRQFQTLLNYFDSQVQLPMDCKANFAETKIKWKQNNNRDKDLDDFKKVLPYRLARKYIMQQIALKPEGEFDYFNIKKEDYRPHSMCYRSVGKVVETDSYVGFLIYFVEDNGWDTYDITLLVTYDYAGRLLDACKVAQHLQIDEANQVLQQKISATITDDVTVMTKLEKNHTVLTKNTKGVEVLEKENKIQEMHFVLQPTGKFFRQALANRD